MTRKVVHISADTFNAISDICQQNSLSKYAFATELLNKALDNQELVDATLNEMAKKDKVDTAIIEKALLEMSAEDLKVLLQKRLRR